MHIENGVKYITMRLSDSNLWGNILTKIFGFTIKTIKDYESSNKPIKDLYNNFKKSYKIPINLLNDVVNDPFFKYYYSETEIQIYFSEWLSKSTVARESYTFEHYKLYEQITIENSYIDRVQSDHYFDEGCVCKACNIKRLETTSKLMRGLEVKDRIIHTEAKTELIQKRVVRATKINKIIDSLPHKNKGKDFRRDMTTIVNKPFHF